MINTTGIQSTGPQGLPGSTSQPAIANEQDEAQFNVMMAQPKPLSSVEELKAKVDELKAKLDTAEDNLIAAKQIGNPIQIMNASYDYQAALTNYQFALSLQNGTLPK
jgi:outer membrane murein-binding lipoprotein Lpp